jgi:hypothetical protein
MHSVHMANTNPTQLQYIPVIRDDAAGTLRIFCANNVQACAAVQVATERGLTAKRFNAGKNAPAPIEVRVTDRRLIPVLDVEAV